MRLYNSASCTPVVASTSGGAKWSTPKTYLPKGSGQTHRSDVGASQLPHEPNISNFQPPQAQTSSDSMSSHQDPPTRRKVLGLFPAGDFLFDIEEDDKTGMPEEPSAGYDDELSRMSSSTLSTHTTLRDVDLPAASIHERTCGIRMPFPTPKNASNGNDGQSYRLRHIVNRDEESAYADKELSHSLEPNRNPFEIIQSGSKTKKTSKGTPRPTNPRKYGKSVCMTMGGLQEPARGCYGDVMKMSRDVITHPSPREDVYTHTDLHQCPQLAMTESSESSSSWLDFSSERNENPFHEPTGMLGQERNVNSFSPIDKAPAPYLRCPVITSKPSLHSRLAGILLDQEQDTRVQRLRQSPSQKPRYFGHRVSSEAQRNTEWKSRAGLERDSCFSQSSRTATSLSNRYGGQTHGSFDEVHYGHPTHTRKDGTSVPTVHVSGAATPTRSCRDMYGNLDFSKYSIMLTSGFSLECVQNAMERDHVDPSIIDLIALASNASRRENPW
jgi:hypothetical protein